ncbi:protein amnionless isoform X1 [Ranitomeya variabilis]|uniref:protein amnionless isoform X1 n=1 Tax=Ranitomeya variabilis TaxID=490064 RepID=UPI004056A114
MTQQRSRCRDHCSHICENMRTVQILLSLLSVIAPLDATYRSWIPDTNFENASNWKEQRVPCGQDSAVFPGDQRVSVFVQSTHALTDLYMPQDGEFLLSHGAGFMAASTEEPDCGKGSSVHFHDVDGHHWFDPSLWRSALSTEDLETGRFLFSVDAESVPCRYDDVLFSPETSFRVQMPETGSDVQLRSISVLGQKFTKNEDFSQYVQLPTGKLQFPGPAQPQITNLICQDATGCLCGNDGMLQEICSVQLQHTGGKCPELPCAAPLQPVGHCCGICGVVISLDYSSAFSLETYRNRLIHTFLSLQKYSSVKLAISKVRSQSSVERLGAELKIQIVLMDEKEGSLAGGDALQLGYDIMADSETHGESFGITRAEMQFATGGLTSPHKGSMSAGAISGIVLGTLLGLLLVAAASYFLYRMDTCRLRYFVVFQFGRNRSTMEDTEPVDRKGFDNPIFESVAENIQGSDCSKDDLPEVTWHKTEFSNPAFDFNL